MLQTLKKVPPNESQMLLSRAAERLLPDPGLQVRPQSPPVDALLEEARERVKVLDLSSLEAKAKVLELLGGEMSRTVLAEADITRIKERLGARGDLRSDLYQIEFGDAFNANSAKRGVRPKHVLDALSHPDRVQHFLPERFSEDDTAISLYLHRPEARGRELFYLLVVTQRKGARQLVLAAYRIYPSDVHVPALGSPLEFLRAFVDTYGIPGRIGEVGPAKFFLYEVLPLVKDNTKIWSAESEIVPSLRGRKIEASMLLKVVKMAIEVALVYAIDASRYAADLKRHRVEVQD